MSKWASKRELCRVSSAAMSATVCSASTARGTISAKLPMGVATTYSIPVVDIEDVVDVEALLVLIRSLFFL